ncbi:hypothetical protein EV1_002772 [Malus domestica]
MMMALTNVVDLTVTKEEVGYAELYLPGESELEFNLILRRAVSHSSNTSSESEKASLRSHSQLPTKVPFCCLRSASSSNSWISHRSTAS